VGDYLKANLDSRTEEIKEKYEKPPVKRPKPSKKRFRSKRHGGRR
jgi:RNA processing factor Prp31